MNTLCKTIFAVALAGILWAPSPARAQISEPDTIFYGQVINRTTGQIDLLTAGKLVWTIVRPDGKTVTLKAALMPLGNGRFSYRLPVPHQVLAYGLTVSDTTVPLPAATTNCAHLAISVDGVPASIVPPGSAFFPVGELLRAATCRLDLELFNPLADTSGDGIPDWWKALYGVTDPNAHPNGDGWSNLQKYQNGGNPGQDNRFPTLLTTEYWVYADGRTEVPLTVVDSDSASTNITFTLATLPANGALYLRNYSNDVALAQGGAFTLDDVNRGRVIFVHDGPTAFAVPSSFKLGLNDEDPAHGTNYTVWLNVYRPDYPADLAQAAQAAANAPFGFADLPGLSFAGQQMLINYYLSRDHGFIVADSARFAMARTNQAAAVAADREAPHVLVGGTGGDRLTGGAAGDILIGGRGNDVLRGNGGPDLFVISGTNSANEVIEDFSTNSADALDLSRALAGASWQLTNYVQLTTDGTNSILAINFYGNGGFTNMTVQLLGTHFAQTDLRALCEGGYLLTGAKALSPSVTIVATQPNASQNGPVAGQFTLARSGPLAAPLTVNLSISGSAVNGSSYELIASQLTFPADQRTAVIDIKPYQTADTLSKVVQISLAAGAGYDIGAASSAQVVIEPLAAQVSIAAVANIAEKSSLTPGIFSVTRGGILGSSISVRLGLAGTASSNSDYTITDDAGHVISPSFPLLSFAANQTEAFLFITPKATASLGGGPKYVAVTLKTNSTYKVMGAGFDRVFIVDQLLDGVTWQQLYFPNAGVDWSLFAGEDPGNKGIKNLYRYAFGLNPTNPVATNGLPFYRILDDHLTVTFRRPLTVTDYDYITQVSDDLVNWSSWTNEVEPYTPPGANTNDVETVTYRAKSPVHGGKPRQFMRVLIQPK